MWCVELVHSIFRRIVEVRTKCSSIVVLLFEMSGLGKLVSREFRLTRFSQYFEFNFFLSWDLGVVPLGLFEFKQLMADAT